LVDPFALLLYKTELGAFHSRWSLFEFAGGSIWCHAACMGYGRLIRVSRYRGDEKAVAYVVALTDPAQAIELIRRKVANPEDEIDDLGRVSDALLTAMKLQPGSFVRA
jgi:hypothetical protein